VDGASTTELLTTPAGHGARRRVHLSLMTDIEGDESAICFVEAVAQQRLAMCRFVLPAEREGVASPGVVGDPENKVWTTFDPPLGSCIIPSIIVLVLLAASAFQLRQAANIDAVGSPDVRYRANQTSGGGGV
jgi:hypothetical protein